MSPEKQPSLADVLHQTFQDYPDFPKPGIIFKDLCPVLQNPQLLKRTIREICKHAEAVGANKIVGIESRGFITGVPAALELNLPFVPARKKGKLPGDLIQQEYELEYGSDVVELQKNAVSAGDVILVVDDLIATGGTAEATGNCIEKGGARVGGFSFLIELGFLPGAARLQKRFSDCQLFSILSVS